MHALGEYTTLDPKFKRLQGAKSHSGGISTEGTEHRFRRRSVPNRCRTFIYLFILFLFSSFWFFFNFCCIFDLSLQLFNIFRALSKNDTPLLFFSEGAFFLEHCFSNTLLIFHFWLLFWLLAAFLSKKVFPYHFTKKKRVRGLIFEKYCR